MTNTTEAWVARVATETPDGNLPYENTWRLEEDTRYPTLEAAHAAAIAAFGKERYLASARNNIIVFRLA